MADESRDQIQLMIDRAVQQAISSLQRDVESLKNESGIHIFVKSTAGDPATGRTGMVCINTNGNTIKMYAEGGWRTLCTY